MIFLAKTSPLLPSNKISKKKKTAIQDKIIQFLFEKSHFCYNIQAFLTVASIHNILLEH